jgi:hypothetical protein
MMARGSEAVEECSIIGEQKQSARLFVKPSDRGDFGIAQSPSRREEIIDEFPFSFIVATDQTCGLVHQNHHSRGGIEGFVIKTDFIMRDFGIAFEGKIKGMGDDPLSNEGSNLFTSAIPQ